MVRSWKAKAEPYEEPDLTPPPPPNRYHAVKDNLFPGTWKAEPVNYRGQGIVYLFRGRGAEEKARAWAERKNAELTK